MTRLRGHFDGQVIVLDQPPPPELRPNTPVDVVVLGERDRLVREMEAFLEALWARPFQPLFNPTQRWRREELYERGGRPVA